MTPENHNHPSGSPLGMGNSKENYVCENCNTTEVNIELLLDKALSRAESDQFYQKIQGCPSCQQRLEKEKSFRSFLHNKVPRHHVSQNLLSSIRDKIRTGNI